MIPQSLVDGLRRGRIIPFVGAGVSRAVRRKADGQPLLPSWGELLLRAAERLDNEGKVAEGDLVRSLLRVAPPDYLEAARRASVGLGSIWPQFLKAEIDVSFGEVDSESLALAAVVWALGSTLVVTTNYDRVMQWASPPERVKDLDTWDIEAKAEQVQLLRDGRSAKPTVWHLHGRIDNAAELILTPDGYRRLYLGGSEGRYKAALTTFRALLASRSLLFIGFSLDDEAVGSELRGINDVFEGTAGPHYALVHERDLERVRALNLPVELVSFADFGDPLLALLRQMGEVGREANPVPSGSGFSDPRPLSPGASYSPDNRPFFVPFRAKGDRVIGRDKALQKVRDQLTGGRPTSIGQTAAFEGLGGLGKTQLAVEYAWRYGDDYLNGVIWLTADQDLAAQLTRLAVEARWVAPESEHKIKLEVAQHRLRSFSDCLTVFDNVEDRAAIEPFLPLPTARPHLLVTSRTEQPDFVPVPLDFLDAEDSIALLALEAGRMPDGEDESTAAREIANELGGLPLALEIAGAYLLHRPVRWQQYRDLLRNNPRAALHSRLIASFTRHEADLYATLRVQEELLNEEPHLVEVLDILTWSGSASMGLSLLTAVLNVPETDLLGALGLGVQLRLLDRGAEGDRYGLHRLLRQVRQAERPLETRREWAEEICRRLGDWFFARRQDFADLPVFEAEIDHLNTWRSQAEALATVHASRLTWLLAYPPHHRGQYGEARRLVEEAFSLSQDEGNKDLEFEACLLADMGALFSMEGRFRDALALHERAFAIRKDILGDQHPDVAQSLDNMGSNYGFLGERNRAFSFYLQAFEIRRSLFGELHPETADSYHNMGRVHCERGEWQEALKFAQQAVEIQRRELGSNHPDTATSIGSIARVYDGLGDSQKALELYMQALKIHLDTVGELHPNTASILSNIGSLFGRRGDSKKALEFSEKALEVRLKVLGEEHPDCAYSLTTMAAAHRRLGELEQALDFGRRGLAIRLRVLGPRHFETIASNLEVATILKDLGRPQEAFDMIAQYLGNPPSDSRQAIAIKSFVQRLRAKPLRPGFRQPPAAGKSRQKKKRRKH